MIFTCKIIEPIFDDCAASQYDSEISPNQIFYFGSCLMIAVAFDIIFKNLVLMVRNNQ
jgi:hypothetical protein